MAVQGYLIEQQAEAAEPVIGVEFDAERNTIVAYIDEGAGCIEMLLTREQVCQLRVSMSQAISEMDWHNAAWLTASEGVSMSATHLMAKVGHDRLGRALCGRSPSQFALIGGGWRLAPLLKEPFRSERNAPVSGTCKRCLAKYDKLKAEAAGE